MNHIQITLTTVAVMLVALINGCSSDKGADGKQNPESSTETRGEHARDRGGDGQGEESGTEYALSETYDEVRNGARLILAYDADTNSFNGTVENTTNKTLERVRVEVHLSNGKELGPTTPADLGPGEKRNIKLTTTGTGFDRWSAHPEVGSEEHSGDEGSDEHGGSEEHGEHGREGRREHN